MNKRMKLFFMLIISVLSLVLISCGGGGGSGSDGATGAIDTTVAVGGDGSESVSRGTPGEDGLEIGSRVSVLESTEEAARSSVLSRVARAINTGSFAAESDYNTDTTQVWVNDRTLESFSVVNGILCSMAQTGYDHLTNIGPYIAQINSAQCEKEMSEGGDAGGGQQGGTASVEVPEYEFWVVDSYVSGNPEDPQVVYFWIENESDGNDEGCPDCNTLIIAKAVIYEQKSASNPTGIFTMNFRMQPKLNDGSVDYSAEPVFKGTLKAFENTQGKVLVSFVMGGEVDTPDGTFEMNERVITQRSADGASGSGSISMTDFDMNGAVPVAFNLVYNSDYFLRTDGANTKCFDRSNPIRNAHRYGLYDATGARVDRSSGLPISYSNGGEIVQGWAGYWGIDLWDQSTQITITDSMTLHGYDWSSNSVDASKSYTPFISEGKLRKVVKETASLASILGVEMFYWSCDNSGCINKKVIWDGTAFKIVAYESQSGNNWSWVPVEPAQTFSLTNLDWTNLNFWSQQFGGEIRVQNLCGETGANPGGNWNHTGDGVTCTSPTYSTAEVTLYKESTVMPGDTIPAAFKCYSNCPDGAQLAADDGSANLWDMMHVEDGTIYNYTFDSANMILKEGVNPIAYDGNQGSLWVGTLIDATAVQPSTTCPWDAGDNSCTWMAEQNLADNAVFYRWESGSENWNKLILLTDDNNAGAFITFEQPLQVKYAGSGLVSILEYGGFGDLWGIPGHCEDGETGLEVSCDQGSGDSWVRWVSDFSIPQGANVSYLNDAGNTVEAVVKALEEEHLMNPVGNDLCTASGLTPVDYSGSLPSLVGWVDPGANQKPTGLDETDIKIIEGILQP